MQNSPRPVGKLEKWLSSPTVKAPERSSVSLKGVSFEEVNADKETELHGLGSRGDPNIIGSMNSQSPFRTPPSLSYFPDEVIMSLFFFCFWQCVECF